MTTVAKLNFHRKQAGLPLIRFNLVQLRDQDIQELRDAYAAMYEISDLAQGDKRGYAALARGHGYDQDLCHNDDKLFLTWHRSYVYSFEKALNTALQWKKNDPDLELTLPFWDWTSFDPATHAQNGLPKVVDDEEYTDASGAMVRNPLASAKSLYRSIALGLSGDEEFTRRSTGRLRQSIPLLENEVSRYMSNPSYESFQDDFNFGAHGHIHVVVGGTYASSPLPRSLSDMGSTTTASFDPVFWLHHCMCDKVWADWQSDKPNANVPQHVLDSVVYDGRIGRDLIDAEGSLRYIYSENSVQSAIGASGTTGAIQPGSLSAAAIPLKEVDLGEVADGFVRAELEFHKLRPPRESFEVQVFINNPACDASTGYDDDSYAGRIVLFGHGDCHGAPGHCNPSLATRDAYDQRDKHPLRYDHTRYRIDFTRGLRRHMADLQSGQGLRAYLLVLDADGERVNPDALVYDQCSLRTYTKGVYGA